MKARKQSSLGIILGPEAGKATRFSQMPFLVQEVFGPESYVCWQHPRNREEKLSAHQHKVRDVQALWASHGELSRRVKWTSTNIPAAQGHTQSSCLYLWLTPNLTFGGRESEENRRWESKILGCEKFFLRAHKAESRWVGFWKGRKWKYSDTYSRWLEILKDNSKQKVLSLPPFPSLTLWDTAALESRSLPSKGGCCFAHPDPPTETPTGSSIWWGAGNEGVSEQQSPHSELGMQNAGNLQGMSMKRQREGAKKKTSLPPFSLKRQG